jgi:hypothetical protein
VAKDQVGDEALFRFRAFSCSPRLSLCLIVFWFTPHTLGSTVLPLCDFQRSREEIAVSGGEGGLNSTFLPSSTLCLCLYVCLSLSSSECRLGDEGRTAGGHWRGEGLLVRLL